MALTKRLCLLALVMNTIFAFTACTNTSSSDPGTDPEDAAEQTSDSEVALKFTLPSDQGWTEEVSSATLNLYATYQKFWDSAPTHTLALGITTSGTATTVEGTCRSVVAGNYIIEVKLANASGSSLRRHLGLITVDALKTTTVPLSFYANVGAISLGGSDNYTLATTVSTSRISICDSRTRNVLKTIEGSKVSTASSTSSSYGNHGYIYGLATDIEPGTYTVYWEFLNSSGAKIGEGSVDSVVVSALATTMAGLSISGSYGSVMMGSATFYD